MFITRSGGSKESGRDTVAWGIGAPAPSGEQPQASADFPRPGEAASLRLWVADPITQVSNPSPGNNLDSFQGSRTERREVPNPLPENDGYEINSDLIEKPKLQALLRNIRPGYTHSPVPGSLGRLDRLRNRRHESERRQGRSGPIRRRRPVRDDESGTSARRVPSPAARVLEHPSPADERAVANRVQKGTQVVRAGRGNAEGDRVTDHRHLHVSRRVPVEQRPDRIVGPRHETVQ